MKKKSQKNKCVVSIGLKDLETKKNISFVHNTKSKSFAFHAGCLNFLAIYSYAYTSDKPLEGCRKKIKTPGMKSKRFGTCSSSPE
jgi:hypothetical protein